MTRYLSKKEMNRKRAWYRVMASLMDFFGSIGSFLVILVCVALITTLLAWFRTDITQSLGVIIDTVAESIVIPDANAR